MFSSKLMTLLLIVTIAFNLSACNSIVKKEVDKIEKGLIEIGAEPTKLMTKMESLKKKIEELMILNKMYYWNNEEKTRAENLEKSIKAIRQDFKLEVGKLKGGLEKLRESSERIKQNLGFWSSLFGALEKIDFNVNIQVPTKTGFRISEEKKLEFISNTEKFSALISLKDSQLKEIELATNRIIESSAHMDTLFNEIIAEPQGKEANDYYASIVYSEAFIETDKAVLDAFMVPLSGDLLEIQLLVKHIDEYFTPYVYIANNQLTKTSVNGAFTLDKDFFSGFKTGDTFGFNLPKGLTYTNTIEFHTQGMELQSLHDGSDNNGLSWIVQEISEESPQMTIEIAAELELTQALEACKQFKVWASNQSEVYSLAIVNIVEPLVFKLPFRASPQDG